MPILYHGTSQAFAILMAGTPQVGTIDVTRGRGEFGQGFYTQDSISNASRRGYLLYGNNGALPTLTVDDYRYHAPRFKRLTLNGAHMLNQRLRKRATQSTYLTKHDLIVGPLVSQPKTTQQEFQTERAETLLNGPATLRVVRP